ncbi:MAG: 30S ribosomal protein S16 [Aeromicrobium sp.]
MAVKIRLKRMGKIRTPFYRIVVADSRTKRDGRVIEEIGTYNPKADPSVITVVSERAQYWLGVGAQPTESVAALLKLTGDWETFTGEKQTRKLEVAAPKRDKADIFNEALKDLHAGESKADATTKKAAAKKAKKKSDKKAEEAPAAPVEEAKVEEAPAAEAAPVEEAKVEEAPVEEAKVEETPAAEATEETKA